MLSVIVFDHSRPKVIGSYYAKSNMQLIQYVKRREKGLMTGAIELPVARIAAGSSGVIALSATSAMWLIWQSLLANPHRASSVSRFLGRAAFIDGCNPS